MTKKEKYFATHPLVEIYNGYEIRKYNDFFTVDASIGIYGTMSNTIKGCYSFIDELFTKGIKQYDDEAVSKYVYSKNK